MAVCSVAVKPLYEWVRPCFFPFVLLNISKGYHLHKVIAISFMSPFALSDACVNLVKLGFTSFKTSIKYLVKLYFCYGSLLWSHIVFLVEFPPNIQEPTVEMPGCQIKRVLSR